MGRDPKGSIKPYRDKQRVRFAGEYVGVFDTVELAAAALASARGLHAAAKQETGAIVTLRSFGEKWLDEREQLGEVRSFERERSCWNAHVMKAKFVDWPLKRISQHDLQKWLRKLKTTPATHAVTMGPRGDAVGRIEPCIAKFVNGAPADNVGRAQMLLRLGDITPEQRAKLGVRELKILSALEGCDGPRTSRELAVLTGFSPTSGSFNRSMTHLRAMNILVAAPQTKPAFRVHFRGEVVGTYEKLDQAQHALEQAKLAMGNDSQTTVLRVTDEPLAQGTIENIRNVLHQCLAQAVIEGKIKNNPLAQLRVKHNAKIIENDEETWTFLTEPEIDAVLAALPDARRKAFFGIAIYAGLRQGEILGLRWRDVVFHLDPMARELQVRRTRNGPVKTETSRREVPIVPALYELLLAWRAEVHRAVVPDLNQLVFPADHGGCFHKGYDCGWADRHRREDGELIVTPGWRTKAGIQRNAVTFHALRHTCASMMVMGGRGFPKLDKERVKKWLGHSSSLVTERYIHLDPSVLREPVGRMYNFVISDESQRAANDADD